MMALLDAVKELAEIDKDAVNWDALGELLASDMRISHDAVRKKAGLADRTPDVARGRRLIPGQPD